MEETHKDKGKQVKRSPQDEALLAKYLEYTASIDLDALMNENLSEWPEFKLSDVELDTLYKDIPRLADLPDEPMITNDKQRRWIVLKDLRQWQR